MSVNKNTIKDEYSKVYLYRRVVQAKLFIDNNYSENINLNHISKEAYFSKFHFIRLFKKCYNKTPHQYLTYVRIERAKELLSNEIKIAETCTLIGFDSLSSFTGLFKKYTGFTPSTFQSIKIQNKKNIKEKPLVYIPGCFAHKNGWGENSNFEEKTIF
jgi:AraC-like DNA-binding protein